MRYVVCINGAKSVLSFGKFILMLRIHDVFTLTILFIELEPVVLVIGLEWFCFSLVTLASLFEGSGLLSIRQSLSQRVSRMVLSFLFVAVVVIGFYY